MDAVAINPLELTTTTVTGTKNACRTKCKLIREFTWYFCSLKTLTSLSSVIHQNEFVVAIVRAGPCVRRDIGVLEDLGYIVNRNEEDTSD